MADNRIRFSNNFVLKDNKVGINTADPQALLDVGGELRVSGASTFTSSVDIETLNVVGVSSLSSADITNLVVSGVSTLGFTTVTGLNVSGVSTLSSVSATTLGVSGVSTLSSVDVSTLSVSGISSLGFTTTSGLYVSGVSTFAGIVTSTGDLYVGGDLYVQNDLLFDSFSANSFDVTNNATIGGNLGIGTTNPTSKLDIIGNVRVIGVSTFTGIVTTSSDLYVGGDLYVQDDLVCDSFSANSFVVTGIATASRFVGNLTGDVNSTGISTIINLVGTSLSYTGVSTFTNGPVLIGSGTSTGTTTQRLQVTGGAYVSGSVGIGTTNPQYKLHVVGDFGATTKSFVIPHPSKPGMKLRYGSLESPYHGIRLTGSSVIKNGSCVVNLPDYICNLVEEDEINIHITNIKHGKVLWVEKVNVQENKFIVMTEEKVGEYAFYWDFTAVRKDVSNLVTEY